MLTLPLTYAGSGVPAGVVVGASTLVRYGLLATFVASLVLLSALFYRHQNGAGRFAPLTPVSEINEKWLQENVFRYPPEVVGDAWDGKTGPSEVAAVLARMEIEKKIRTEVKTAKSWFRSKPILHLTLLTDRYKLEGYEKALVKKLFFEGNTTDTESLGRHYKDKGFDPVAVISDGVTRPVNALPGDGQDRSPPGK